MAKSYLCIGAGPGMGVATAIKFAKEGFKPILGARNYARLEQLAAEVLEKTGQKAEIAELDAGDATQVRELAKKYSNIDVLHYNAAIVHSQRLEEANYDDLEMDIRVGITGALYAIKAFSTNMLARQSGTILLTGGILALHPVPEYLALGVAKSGIRNMTEALFGAFRQKNVHIANVTVAASVAPHSKEANEVADLFWRIYSQEKSRWTWNEDYGADK